SARLSRGFYRTWSTWVGYNRATEYRVGFREPLLSDSADAGIGGQFLLRVRGFAGGNYTHAGIGFSSNDFNVYSGTSRLDFAPTPTLSVYGQYAYNHYAIPPGSSSIALVPWFSRQVGTVGLSLSLALVNDIKAPKEPPRP